MFYFYIFGAVSDEDSAETGVRKLPMAFGMPRNSCKDTFFQRKIKMLICNRMQLQLFVFFASYSYVYILSEYLIDNFNLFNLDFLE